MRTRTAWLSGLLVAAFILTAAPQQAEAAFRLGADALWMPIASENLEAGNSATDLDSSHEVMSFGASGHFNLGFDILSLGLKLNYFNQGLEIKNGEDTRRNELDINVMVRTGIPGTDLALFGEGGGSMSTDFDGFGYNVGAGAEYDILGLPLIDLNLGVMGQWVKLPSLVNDISTDAASGRALLFLGADFSL